MTKHTRGYCAGCAYMHRHRIPERDVKADHILSLLKAMKARDRRRRRKNAELSFFGITAKDLNMNPNRRR